jgi:hypothetical protein
MSSNQVKGLPQAQSTRWYRQRTPTDLQTHDGNKAKQWLLHKLSLVAHLCA